MPITLWIRSGDPKHPPKLTFDGTQRVVVGRGASCDVRLPDASVSARHATIRASGADFLLVDEGSTNGTFVGDTRLAPHTTRVLKNGDRVRVGRVWLEVKIDVTPVTRDVANVARQIALALVESGLRALGRDVTMKVHVVKGPDAGAVLALAEEGRVYLVGPGSSDLRLTDPTAGPEPVSIVRRGNVVLVGEHEWRSTNVMKLGNTTLALEEPVADALLEIEQAPDEIIVDEPEPQPEKKPEPPAAPTPPRKATWSAVDILVLVAAALVLALSLAGFVWLVRG